MSSTGKMRIISFGIIFALNYHINMATIVAKHDTTKYPCGATLISASYALTAKHCVIRKSESDYQLLLGAYDLTDPGSDAILMDIRRFILYDSDDFRDDIAVIALQKYVEFSPYIQPICLPPKDYTWEGVTATLLGYGDTSTRKHRGKPSNVPLAGDVIVTSQDVCKAAIKQYGGRIGNRLCSGAYDGQPDQCFGDSGGPLMYFDPHAQAWELIGIISGNFHCGDVTAYSFQTNVSHFVYWIRTKDRNTSCRITDL